MRIYGITYDPSQETEYIKPTVMSDQEQWANDLYDFCKDGYLPLSKMTMKDIDFVCETSAFKMFVLGRRWEELGNIIGANFRNLFK